MNRVRLLLALGAIGFSSVANAGSAVGTILSLYMGNVYGGMVFVQVSTTKTNNPACNNNATYGFVLPLTTALENQIYAALLSARATGVVVTLVGTGLCDTYSGVETLTNIIF